MEFKPKRKKNITIDITPVVDTVFNLLIFFALSLNFSFSSSIDINLPKITSPKRTDTHTQTYISILPDGALFINRQPVEMDLLAGMLRTAHAAAPNSHVVIEADQNITHGTVVSVMDQCKRAGFTRISIAAHLTENP